jgi:hypothetical protein
MQRLASDAEFRARLRANARQARAQLDWYSQEPAFFAAYRQALGATGGSIIEKTGDI